MLKRLLLAVAIALYATAAFAAGPIWVDRVQDTSTTAGTTDFVLSGTAPTGLQPWSTVGNTNTAYYVATDTAGDWEQGLGTYSSTGPTLARTTVIASSNSGSKVSFPAGTKTISLTPDASYFAGGAAGFPVIFNGAGGTPSSLTGTNISGTAASLTAGHVTTNANLTGPITSSGNATTIASQTGTGSKFVVDTSPALAGTPTAPTASPGTNTTQIATTAFVLANAGGGMTLLGTLTTTSGSTQTLSGLTLTAYSSLFIVYNSVSMNSSATFKQNSISLIPTTAAANSTSGISWTDLATGISTITTSIASGGTTTPIVWSSGLSTASTAITFTGTATFDNGSIDVYGVP